MPRIKIIQISPQSLKNFSLFFLVIGVTIGCFVEMGLGWDFANFYDAGRKVISGQIQDLYNRNVQIGEAPSLGRMQFLGTPLSASFYTLFAWLPPSVALIVFKIQNTLSYLLGIVFLYKHCIRFSDMASREQAKFTGIFYFMLLIYQPFWTIYRVGGQTTPTVFLLFVVALTCYISGRFLLASLFLTLAVAIKPAFILALGFLALISERKFLWCVTAIGLAFIAVSIAAFGLEIHHEFMRQVLFESTNHKAWLYNSSLSVVFDNWYLFLNFVKRTDLPSISFLTVAVFIIRLSVLGLYTWLVMRSRSLGWSPIIRRHFNFFIAIPFALMMLPTVWEHYLALLFIPLACILSCYRQLSRNALALIIMVFLSSIGQNLVLVLWLDSLVGFESLPTLIAAGLFKSLPLMLMFIFLWKYHNEVFKIHTISSMEVSS